MVLPSVFLIHSGTLRSKKKLWSLNYDGGSAVFTPGKTLTGATSHATAIVVSIGTVATGTLTLHTIIGVFQNNETLSDNGTIPGAAVADGVVAEAFDAYGQPSFADVDSTVACKFVAAQKKIGAGLILETLPRVLFAPTVTVTEGDQLISTETGYAGTFGIRTVKMVYEAAVKTVSHISCEIGAVV